MKSLTGLIVLVCAASLVGCSAWLLGAELRIPAEHTIALLVPDALDDAEFAGWIQAASEEGIKLEPLTASAFLRPFGLSRKNYVGIILPDSVHRRGNAMLIDKLKRYVHEGGALMLVHDALTLDLAGSYAPGKSRLSDVAGVDYALYRQYGDQTLARDAIGGTAAAMVKLGITPGRFNTENPRPQGSRIVDRWLTTYHYDKLEYPLFMTAAAGVPDNVLLMAANGSVAAIENSFGSGKSLFVNVPLGLLQTRTDGLLLHAFLRYFSDDVVALPRLLSSPKGIGGLVLNIHVDSGAAIPNLNFMQSIGALDQGPYSIHFTAGPDVDTEGDAKGMDAERSPSAQAWIRELAAKGHAIGNHGGWIHNHFGKEVTERNQDSFTKYLVKNDDVMRRILGKPLLEYAAPNGNHPDWVTDWLVKQKVVAYYTTANGGTGATRMVDAKGAVDRRIWSIPVTPFGRIASFEEAMFSGLPHRAIARWLDEVSNFTADTKNIRLIYCHPLGMRFYAGAVTAWMKTTASLARNRVFKWYTMTEVAQFMSRRELTTWRFDHQDGEAHLLAAHPQSLTDMTWTISKKQCEMPRFIRGHGVIGSYPAAWQIIAGDVTALELACSVPAPPA
ncbi:MAG: polysaccharide deacetylase family protein [Herminiimonas sp.]|nr:polysaccharide deacetylase family protein [Herminiimonas sp.]